MQQLLARQLEVSAHLPRFPPDNNGLDEGEDGNDHDDSNDDEDGDDDDDNASENGTRGGGNDPGARDAALSGGTVPGRQCPYPKCRRKGGFKTKRGLTVHYQTRLSRPAPFSAAG